ncbi:hypothetical protein ORV05_22560 [Amycolatopsis cynarae]|uniref:Uncharacterized protein n=1 Tax=Amycolatopsis cynarae TaxID=2995223 RepID=A0ABY7AX63_9PSEU|nr:hypothetical protein [Amycolatopsis sp. HUAS 11-8]WAL63774.1 hypothetical protein ORV05_22560 [Amycolatopsis sp. HUAS 11-8]
MLIFPEPGAPVRGTLIYSESEYGFRFNVANRYDLHERIGDAGVSSLSIGTLQLEFGVASRQLLFAWGLHPKGQWVDAKVVSPVYAPSIVLVDPDLNYTEGVSVAITPVGSWITEYDRQSGWVVVSAARGRDVDLFEIAEGVLLGRRDGELSSVWLKPAFE